MRSRSPDSVFLDQVAWRIAAGIAAVAALAAAILTTANQNSRDAPMRPPVSTPGAASPVSSARVPPPLEIGGDVARCIEFCARHVSTERSFVVFSNGTCVIVNEPTIQPIVDALHTLEECAVPNAHFITRQIEDGHHLVTYRQAVFHCLFSEEISTHRNSVERNFFQYLSPEEQKSMAAGFDPPFHAKLGLMARARLNLDGVQRTVSKLIRAKPLVEPPEQTAETSPTYELVGPPNPEDPAPNPLVGPPFLPSVEEAILPEKPAAEPESHVPELPAP